MKNVIAIVAVAVLAIAFAAPVEAGNCGNFGARGFGGCNHGFRANNFGGGANVLNVQVRNGRGRRAGNVNVQVR